jgi:hypothetical protein
MYKYKNNDLQNSSDDLNFLKTININDSEETKSFEVIDYKKMQLAKLKSIVTEKGLVTDASKLKKNELLHLLGSE